MDFWQSHGVVIGIIFLICAAVFPRLTMLFAVATPFGWLAWLGWLIAPHFTVAMLASVMYWQTNPLLVVAAWIAAFVGTSGEATTAQRKVTGRLGKKSEAKNLREAVDDVYGMACEAEDLIRAFGSVIVQRGEEAQKADDPVQKIALVTIIPESFLPSSQEQIKEAIRLSFTVSELDQSTSQALFEAYQQLAHFVPDEKAKMILGKANTQNADYFFEAAAKVTTDRQVLAQELEEYITKLEEDRRLRTTRQVHDKDQQS